MMNEVISIKNFTKKYEKFIAVENMNLSVKRGSVFGLLGPNGAGKTTTIKAMTGRVSISKGSISVLDFNTENDINNIHQKIGVVSEAQNLYEHMTVFENIDFFRELYNIDKSKSDEIIDTLSLTEKRNTKVSKLSKGLKQRVLLGRSILHSPEVLFLDEPTSGLDPHSSNIVHNFIRNIRDKGTTVFLTTHYMEEADILCDDIAFIYKGHIVAQGTPKVLKNKFGSSDVEVSFIEDGVEKTQTHSMDSEDTFSKISELHKKHKILSIHTKEATMKDVFLNLVAQSEEV